MVTKHQLQKLETELKQLNGRIDRLTVFIDCDQGFSKLSTLEKYSLIMQRRGMKEYSYHLSKRIDFYRRVRENINA